MLWNPGDAGISSPDPAAPGGVTEPTLNIAMMESATRTHTNTPTQNATPSRKRTVSIGVSGSWLVARRTDGYVSRGRSGQSNAESSSGSVTGARQTNRSQTYAVVRRSIMGRSRRRGTGASEAVSDGSPTARTAFGRYRARVTAAHIASRAGPGSPTI